ncbi:MAG: 8-oxo-dGTP diphosphatase [Treponema sp.]|nr:8-oxo-dGTP diphosphatase [Treponema sp.]
MKSQLTTLCYIEENDSYLMLHRTVKANDENHDKWIGVGGHFEGTESPEECLLREVKEETGLTLNEWSFRGIVTFVSDDHPAEYMHLFTSSDFTGKICACDEGELEWVQKAKIPSLNLWEGDKIFLKLLAEGAPFFSLKLVYKNGQLIRRILDGKEICC